ncbi:MAG: helix-turn-helix transcriptional regulator [Betaproteobacteria bacterium]
MTSDSTATAQIQNYRRHDDVRGNSRLGTRARASDWVGPMLNHIDYGIVALEADRRVSLVNAAAYALLAQAHPLHIRAGELCAHHPSDLQRLDKALAATTSRGLRTLLALGPDEDVSVAVVPLMLPQPGVPGTAMLVLGRALSGDNLATQWYARNHGLTLAECRVLGLLCVGAAPGEIARRQGVAVSTIRTQIGSIRAKTGTSNVGALIRRVSALPPLVSALQTGVTA